MAYIGQPFNGPSTGAVQHEAGNGSTTAYTLDFAVGSSESVACYLHGVRQVPGSAKDYTAAGVTLTFSTAVPSGVSILIQYLALPIALPEPGNATVTKAKITTTLIHEHVDTTITAADSILFSDSTDSNTNKKDTVQGILDLAAHTGNVAFPATQSASGDANTLDDYEEGTFSPVLGGSGGQSGQSYSTQLGVYTKIGRIVHCSGYINLGTKGTITATLQLSGLPFTAGTGSGFNSAGSLITINAWTIAAGTYVQFGINNASATANFRSYLGTGSSANGANMATANVNNGTHVSFNITYAV